MFCTQCGTEVGDRNTCPACGAAAPRSGSQAPPSGPTTPPPSTPVPPVPPVAPSAGNQVADDGNGRGKGHKRLLMALAILVVVAAGVVAALVLTKGKADKKPGQVATADSGSSKTPSGDATEKTTTTEKKTTTTPVPAEMPDLVGLSVDQARAKVSDLGITVKAVNVVSVDKASGTIVSQTPAAGAPFEKTVVINVARPAVKTYLADLKSVEGQSLQAGTATLNATAYTHALSAASCSTYSDNAVTTGFDLSRTYTRLLTKVGVSDDSPSGSSVKFEVLGDGRTLASTTAGLGAPQDIDVDVTGVLRLQIVSTALSSGTGTCTVVWADPQLTSPPPANDSAVTTTTGQ